MDPSQSSSLHHCDRWPPVCAGSHQVDGVPTHCMNKHPQQEEIATEYFPSHIIQRQKPTPPRDGRITYQRHSCPAQPQSQSEILSDDHHFHLMTSRWLRPSSSSSPLLHPYLPQPLHPCILRQQLPESEACVTSQPDAPPPPSPLTPLSSPHPHSLTFSSLHFPFHHESPRQKESGRGAATHVHHYAPFLHWDHLPLSHPHYPTTATPSRHEEAARAMVGGNDIGGQRDSTQKLNGSPQQAKQQAQNACGLEAHGQRFPRVCHGPPLLHFPRHATVAVDAKCNSDKNQLRAAHRPSSSTSSIVIPTDDELRAFLKKTLGSAYPHPSAGNSVATGGK